MTPRGTAKKINFILNLNTYSATSLIFDLKVSLDRVHQDINLCLWGYPTEGIRTRRTKKDTDVWCRYVLSNTNAVLFCDFIDVITRRKFFRIVPPF